MLDRLRFLYRNSFISNAFQFEGETYAYFSHPYNQAWRNERTVEVPVVLALAPRAGRILEIGNVLSHHYPHFEARTIVDKYEVAPGVTNCDVFDIKTRYDVIISISTLEHVGFDECYPPDEHKIRRLFTFLRTLLKPGGVLVFSMPLGYNSLCDQMAMSGICSKEFYMKRISRKGQWKQVTRKELMGVKYGSPYDYGNYVMFGVIEKKRGSELGTWRKSAIRNRPK